MRDVETRRREWDQWIMLHIDTSHEASIPLPPGTDIILVGFIHQCSQSNLFDGWDMGVIDVTGDLPVCTGCRHHINRPLVECQPLFGHLPD